MARVKRGVAAHRRHKRLLAQARAGAAPAPSWFARRARRCSTPWSTPTATARPQARHAPAVDRADQCRLAPARPAIRPFHRRPEGGGRRGDRKVLADLAVREPAAFAAMVDTAKASFTT